MSPCEGERRLGWIVGESTPRTSLVLFSDSSEVPRVGTYVVAESPAGCVFGMIESVTAGNRLLTEDVTSPESVEGLIRAIRENPSISPSYVKGVVRWLSMEGSLVQRGSVELPKVPPRPGVEVFSASRDLLIKVFSPPQASSFKGEEGADNREKARPWVPLGTLMTEESIEYSIDVNRLTRHLAVLAITGGGKSNTVCVLSKEIVMKHRGTVVIFDMHGEYGNLGLSEDSVNRSPPAINPLMMSFSELLELARVPENATNQQRALRQAFDSVWEEFSSNKLKFDDSRTFIDALLGKLNDMNEEGARGAYNRVLDVRDNYGDVLSHGVPLDLKKVIAPRRLNVFDLSEADENAADAIVSHYLRRLLSERKAWKHGRGGYPIPVFVVIEEAHVLIPAHGMTLTKYWASRIAREGRKFGVGLIVVSQRPRNVDPDVLSQTNNKIILRIVEPQDIRYVQDASEELSEDLASILPSLNPGEAVVIGSMVKLPAVIKVNRCEGKRSGGDIDVVGEWRKWGEEQETQVREGEKRLQELL
ncbi:MAG: helicase HerA domain-containing protein [Acidilobus sp.]